MDEWLISIELLVADVLLPLLRRFDVLEVSASQSCVASDRYDPPALTRCTMLEALFVGALVTDRVDVPFGTPLKKALIEAVPAVTLDTSPVLLICATPVFDDDHVTSLLRFCDVPSE